MDSLQTSLMDYRSESREIVRSYKVLERPDSQRIPFLLRINYCARTTNGYFLFTSVANLGLQGALFIFGLAKDLRCLLVALSIDLFCQVGKIVLACTSLQTKREGIGALGNHLWQMIFRIGVTASMATSILAESRLAAWCCLVSAIVYTVACCLRLDINDRVVGPLHALTAVLMAFKATAIVEIDWLGVFWPQETVTWAIIFMLTIYLAFWVIVGLSKLCNYANIGWHSIVCNILYCLESAASRAYIFPLCSYLDSKDWSFTLTTVSSVAFALHTLYALACLCLEDHLIFSLRLSSVAISEVHYQLPKRSVDEASLEICCICQEKEIDCLLMPCAHKTPCSRCASHWLEINALCPACDSKIDHAVVFKQAGDSLEAYKEFCVGH